jgi:N-acyl-D-amino-acid deacylase
VRRPFALDLLARGGGSLVSFNMNERDIGEITTRPYTMTSTDGDLVQMGVGKPRPRARGAFARKVADKATYEDPHQLSVGIDTVLVNGKVTRDEGAFTSELAGGVVSPQTR